MPNEKIVRLIAKYKNNETLDKNQAVCDNKLSRKTEANDEQI